MSFLVEYWKVSVTHWPLIGWQKKLGLRAVISSVLNELEEDGFQQGSVI